MAASPSVARGEDALQGNDKIQYQIGLLVGVRLAAADITHGPRLERGEVRSLVVNERWAGRQEIVKRHRDVADTGRSVHEMKVRRHGLHADGDTLGAAGLAKRERLAKMNRHLPPQV